MSIDAVSVSPSRRPSKVRGPQARTQSDDPINPARGVMIGLGISALIWTGIGALVLR